MTGSVKEELFMVLWIICGLLARLNGFVLASYLCAAIVIWSLINLLRASHYEFKELRRQYEKNIAEAKDNKNSD